MSTSVPGHTAHGVERPERSRNAKAQARHRAKRKAYIEQLEQTVTKLQTALGYTPEQVSALPPPLVKIRELEQEVARLQKENDDLRNLVAETNGRGLPGDFTRRNSYGSYQDARLCDRTDYKRRKHVDGVYLGPNDAPLTDSLRPPPLTIPQPLAHHYGNLPSSVTNHNGTAPSSLFNLHGPTFPNTPSGSSSTSSPPFSAMTSYFFPSSQQPAQMQPSNHHLPNHRPSSMTNHSMPGFSQSHSYESIKMEDENYPQSGHPPHHSQYPVPPYTHTPTSTNMDTWPSYSSERALHR
ncbi:hypothetical protein P691DRAFT_722659 [Macrolepiota fuliginosa MF-IS2]|uniref:BZIP domain-containing protein n=1 Tax=Macrolepiota fuliginosa MF-IS2 TaxID=1400762 RepID=A0A9P5XIN5_9AGAR|nr:hypothetical protein P691DRAFT_722659 [Macrolepiota fuliginosa MF-IS2]